MYHNASSLLIAETPRVTYLLV